MHYAEFVESHLPLFKYRGGPGTQETGIVETLFEHITDFEQYAVEFGQRKLGGGTLGPIAKHKHWNLLNMDAAAIDAPADLTLPDNCARWRLERHNITPANIVSLFKKYAVSERPACVSIDIDGMDYWVARAMLKRYRPILLIVEYNCHIPIEISASLEYNESHVYDKTKNYGASFRAFVELAHSHGYTLIHIHGPLNLFFLHTDITLPKALCLNSEKIGQHELNQIADAAAFYELLFGDLRPSWIDAPAPNPREKPWSLIES